MHGEPIPSPVGSADRSLTPIGLRVAFAVVGFLVAAVRVLAGVMLRLLRPLIMLPLLLVMVGGVGAAIVLASGHQWCDAGKAGLVALMSALLLVIYSRAAVWIDPGHFDHRNLPSWRRP